MSIFLKLNSNLSENIEKTSARDNGLHEEELSKQLDIRLDKIL